MLCLFYVMLKHDFLLFSYSISIFILHKELPKVTKKVERRKEKKQREPSKNCLVNIPWGELLQDVLGFGSLNTNKNSQLNSLRAEIFEVDEFEVVSLNLWLSSMNS